MTDKIVIATGLPDANIAAIGGDTVAASNDALAAEGNAGVGAVVPASVGELLRTTRDAQGMSAGDIAAKLRMGVRQIVALESSDFPALPTGTFLRGFVRNYAKAVGLNADEVLLLLEKTHTNAAVVDATPVVVPAQQNITMPTPGGELATPKARAVAAALVVVLLLGAVWYWWEYVRPHLGDGGRAREKVGEEKVQPPAIRTPEAPAPVVTPDPVVPAPVTNEATPGETTQAVSAVPANTAAIPSSVAPVAPAGLQAAAQAPVAPALVAAPADKPVPPPAAAKGGGVLGFTFKGDSWVEVTDGSGKIVLSKRFAAGEAEEVNGRLPLSVVIGNAQVTRMAFNGREFDLVPFTRVSVARVTVK